LPEDLNTREGRVALLLALVDLFQAPLPKDEQPPE
jgi:hypothetical protein